MSKLLEKSLDELCANTVETVDRIMGRYNVGLEEACSVAGITPLITVSGKKMHPRSHHRKQSWMNMSRS